MAAKGQRRPRLSPKTLSIASLIFIIFGAALPADAKSTTTHSRTRATYSEPTPAEGGKVVRYNLTLGVAKKAPDCYRELVLVVSFWSLAVPRGRDRKKRRETDFFRSKLFIKNPEKQKIQ